LFVFAGDVTIENNMHEFINECDLLARQQGRGGLELVMGDGVWIPFAVFDRYLNGCGQLTQLTQLTHMNRGWE
jgi:hypothetical protein